MEQRRMGNSSIVCSTVGFGTWEMGKTQYGHIDENEAMEAIRFALDNGITLFDTAEAYGTEAIVGEAAKHYDRDQLVISTKAHFDATSRPALGSWIWQMRLA